MVTLEAQRRVVIHIRTPTLRVPTRTPPRGARHSTSLVRRGPRDLRKGHLNRTTSSTHTRLPSTTLLRPPTTRTPRPPKGDRLQAEVAIRLSLIHAHNRKPRTNQCLPHCPLLRTRHNRLDSLPCIPGHIPWTPPVLRPHPTIYPPGTLGRRRFHSPPRLYPLVMRTTHPLRAQHNTLRKSINQWQWSLPLPSAVHPD